MRKFQPDTHLAKPARMLFAADLFYGLFILCFILLAEHNYSVLQWIINPRIGYQLYRTGAGQWYAFCITFLALATVLGTVYALSTRAFLIRMLLSIFGVYLLGSKGFIITFTAYFLVILSIRRTKYFGILFIGLTSIASVLFVYSFVTAMAGIGLEQIAAYSDYFVNDARYYQRLLTNQLPLYHGQIFLTSFWQLVPRAIYPEKPYVYGPILLDEVFYPGAAQKGSTPAFATAPYFADFGWPGVILSSLFSLSNVFKGLLYAFVLPRLDSLNLRQATQHPRLILYAFLILAAPAFLTFFLFPFDFIFFGFIVLSVEIICRLKILRIGNASEHSGYPNRLLDKGV